MVQSVHHINFIVRDLAEAVPVWERVLGKPAHAYDQLEGRGMVSVRFDIGGTWIVLVQPTGPGVPADHLRKNGEGFFLMSLGVDSLEAEIDRSGSDLLHGRQRAGVDHWRVQDLDIAKTLGAQLQYAEDSGLDTI